MIMQSEEPDSPPLEVTLFHYLAWPDHGVPTNAISMVNFIKRVRKTHPYNRQDLLLVHCSAGVGRTGTFITLDSMLERIKDEDNLNIYEFVSNLRKQRVLMVQTLVSSELCVVQVMYLRRCIGNISHSCMFISSQSQYAFIHDALEEFIVCGETEIAAANMRISIGKLRRVVSSRNVTEFHHEFEVT